MTLDLNVLNQRKVAKVTIPESNVKTWWLLINPVGSETPKGASLKVFKIMFLIFRLSSRPVNSNRNLSNHVGDGNENVT